MKVVCPTCNAEYNIRDDKIPKGGSWAKCKKCGNRIKVTLLNGSDGLRGLSNKSSKKPTSPKYSSKTPVAKNTPDTKFSENKRIIDAKDNPAPAYRPFLSSAGFKDPTKLTTALKFLLIFGVVLSAIATWSDWLEYELLASIQDGMDVLQTEAESNDLRQGLIGVIQLGLFILTAIIFLKWIYRANYNARRLGAKDMKFTPGWAVGYYFIPIVNLWKPCQAMKEIWQASQNPADWKNQSVGSILGVWWTVWIFSSVMARAASRLSLKAEEVHELIRACMTTMLSNSVDILLGIVAFILIGKIHDMQMAGIGKPI